MQILWFIMIQEDSVLANFTVTVGKIIYINGELHSKNIEVI